MRELGSALNQPKASVGIEKVLIVVDRFPATGGSRIDKFVKLLPDCGFEPVVLSAKETDSPEARELRARIYPPGLKTYQAASLGWTYFTERFLVRGPGARHYRLLSLLSLPERVLLVPDYMVRWIPLGMRLASEIVRREGIQVVLTSSPSESVHLIGLRLKRKLAIRWVADFRDLWTEKKLLYRPATPLHDRLIQRLERKVFETADHIVANTPENAERYVARFNLPRDRLTVIPNGFDRDDLTQQAASGKSSTVFRVGYAGSLDKHDFPWGIALQALKRLALEVGRDKVRMIHCGYLSEQVKNYLRDEQIEDIVEAHGNLPHVDAMRITADTAVRLVLLYENAYSASIVPLKLYNYLIMNGPILAIAPEEGRTAAIIAETRMGVVVSARRGLDAVYGQLHGFYQAWRRGELSVDPDYKEIERYDRHTQAKTLAGILRAH
jgi:glycosyltransferase involved in cell wall biosynthesis